MGAFRKVVLTRQELIRIIRALGGEELPSRQVGSHRRFRVVIDGTVKLVTIAESIDEFVCNSHLPLWFIVQQQLGISWERFYSADERVARRANVKHRRPR